MGIYAGPIPINRENYSSIKDYIDARNRTCDEAKKHDYKLDKIDMLWYTDYEIALNILEEENK